MTPPSIHVRGQFPDAVAREVIRLLRSWQDAPHAFYPPPSSLWRAPIVVMDGQSGSGKSTMMRQLTDTLRMAGVRHLHVARPDEWFPGWHGLHAGSELTAILLTGQPLLRGTRTRAAHPPLCGRRLWDWETNTWAGVHLLDPTRPLLIEGSGSLTPVTAAAASLRIWVEAPTGADGGETERRERALTRDGATFEPWWEVWAAQEATHIAAHNPRSLADYVVVNHRV